MVRKAELQAAAECELWKDDEFAQFQTSGDHGLAELSQVVLVSAADLFDEAVNTEALEQPRHLPAVFLE